MSSKNYIVLLFSIFLLLNQSACGPFKYKKVSAKDVPTNVRDRVKKNMEEGRGFRLMDKINSSGSGNFEFASSNELWRASLDTIDFMPLASVNYSGGIIITDWYSNNNNPNETIKITIRFLSNEIRADAIDINVFFKKCSADFNCVVQKNNKTIESELRKEILKKATLYQKQTKQKNKSFYPTPKMGGEAQ